MLVVNVAKPWEFLHLFFHLFADLVAIFSDLLWKTVYDTNSYFDFNTNLLLYVGTTVQYIGFFKCDLSTRNIFQL